MPDVFTPGGSTGRLIPPSLANPLADANVTPERIDQGVDYAGTGSLAAISRGVIKEILGSGSGWPGNFISYQVTDKSSPLYGQHIFYAEGVNPIPGLKVGQVVNPGEKIADLIPGWHSGIELGFASGVGSQTYAGAHGGYTEGRSTAAGKAFSDFIAKLGGPPGKLQPGPLQGTPPDLGSPNSPFTNVSPFGVPGNLIGGAVDAGEKAISFINSVGDFFSNPGPALLTIGLVLLGAMLVYSGGGRLLGVNAPVTSTARAGVRRVREASEAAG